jgi:hypothetical protein
MAPRYACSTLATVADFTAASCACAIDDETIIERYLDDASDLIYTLSRGQIFGECSATVRPCRCCFCGCCLSCCSVDTVPLRAPVIAITQIKIDGDVLSPSEYTLLPRARVMRVATSDTRPPAWPGSQDLWKPDTEEGTFSITYTFGMEEPFPQWVTNAVVELACDWANWDATGRSMLPAGTTNVVYQNVSASRFQRASALEEAADVMPAVSRFFGITSSMGNGGVYSVDGVDGWTFPLS